MSPRALLPAALLAFLAALAAPGHAAGEAPSDDGTAPPASLAELLDRVRNSAQLEARRAREREARFLAARERQEALLEEVRSARIAADREADRLQDEYEAGEERLADLETALAEQSGDLEELFSIVRQAATDVRTLVGDSLVSAERPDRLAVIDELAAPESVPDADDLRGFWLLLLDEMEGSGRVARFEAPVIGEGGEENIETVTRIGTFTAVSDGRYLRFLPETGRLLALAQGPETTTPAETRAFENAAEPILPVAVDPSRGSILALMVQSPGLEDRVRQGGIIGFIILGIGAIGLVIAAERGVRLSWTRHVLDTALAGKGEHRDLSALEAAARDPDLAHNPDGLAARFDEVITAASRRLHRGISTLSIFAAVSPLLGLLGTVTGMIETFQVITLFGAGDPRLMSGGISQALVTTQLGLCVAIPLLLLHSFVQGRANIIVGILDERSARLFARTHPDRGDGPAAADAEAA